MMAIIIAIIGSAGQLAPADLGPEQERELDLTGPGSGAT